MSSIYASILDIGDYYQIYGVITLIVIILLLWFFIRTSMESSYRDCMTSAPGNTPDASYTQYVKEIDWTDKNYKRGDILHGVFKDDPVPIYMYSDYDDQFASMWRKPDAGFYTPNSKLYWRTTLTPREKMYWLDGTR